MNNSSHDNDNKHHHRRHSHLPNHSYHHQSITLAADTVSDLDENDNSTIRTETVRGGTDSYSVTQTVITTESNTMRVRISNESSKRYKFLVVDVKPDLTVHDAIYDHKGVRSAQVRKWTPEIVRGVRKKTKEIQCALLDGGLDGNIKKIYSLDDLKKVSTRDLFDLAPQSNPVQLFLRCVETNTNTKTQTRIAAATTETVVPNPTSNNNDVRKIFSEQPTKITSTSTPALACETSLNKLLSSTKKSRPNHMNLSGLGNATFATTGNLVGSKNQSISDINSMSSRSRSKSTRLRSEPFNLQKLSEPFSTNSIDSKSHSNSDDTPSHATAGNTEDPKETMSSCLARSNSLPLIEVNKSKPRGVSLSHSLNLDNTHIKEKLSKFTRLRNSKMSIEIQREDTIASASTTKSCSSNSRRLSLGSTRNEKFTIPISDFQKGLFADSLNGRTYSKQPPPPSSDERSTTTSTTKKSVTLKASDKISRFLTFGANRKMPVEGLINNSISLNSNKNSLGTDETEHLTGEPPSTDYYSRGNSHASLGSAKSSVPPIAEIEVVKGSSRLKPVLVDSPSIPLSGDLVKEVFPYHIVIDEDFQIIQIGNSLSRIMGNRELVGRCISDIFVITGPMPSFGRKWEWALLDKMKEKVFLEGIHENSLHQKPKIKGSIIELTKTPQRQVLLLLSPNVKNLSELESMNLSMIDLPIHSCQRDAVLLGEHSKSEVKLTNHLDLRHRELIDTMEKQIEDRTNELATANKNLEFANARLASQKAKQLEHFACMSHEIRTPLNCIVGMSSLLLEDSEGPSMDPMHADSIRMINTSGELLRAVVDDVLDYAKLESGSFEVVIKSTRLQDTIDSVLYSISQKFQEKNVRLRPHFTPTVPEYLETDNRRLQQVLFNLLGNAGKFSKPDSVIDLSVSVVKGSPDNRINEESGDGDLIRFSIRDYGKGIDTKDFETIFQPFSQASKETQNIYGGTGLGLSITSKLVHRLGGTINLDSELGKYADFTVDLPMNGKCVDVEKISNSLKHTTIVLIEPKQTGENDSSIPFPFRGDPVPLDADVVEVYGLNVIRCNTLDELSNKIPEEKDEKTQRHFTLLVHETLYQLCSTEKLESIFGQSRHALISFGANFLVEKTKAYHLKSLTGLFPATLLDSISKQSYAQRCTNDADTSMKSRVASGVSASSDLSFPLSAETSSLPGTRIDPATTGKFTSNDARAKCMPRPSNTKTSTPSGTNSANKNTEARNFKDDLKVLYAEDNLVNQKVLTRVLHRYGISDVTIVDNGKKAVDISATIKYDCILLDIQMPVMGGMEACKLITERDPDTIIIFVTAHALDEFRVKAKAAGAKGFISKPFRLGDIDTVLTDIYTT